MNKVGRLAGVICLALMLAFPTLIWGSTADSVAEDLQPVAGYVVGSLKDEFIIDLDAGDGLRVGDLVSVITPGDNLVHPVTDEVIGQLDQVKAVLKVTRLHSGYSFAEIISGDSGVGKGERIRRFSGLTAVYVAPQGKGKRLYAQLRELLPELAWQGRFLPEGSSEKVPQTDIRFVRKANQLLVLDQSGQELRSYRLAEAGSDPSVTAPPPDVATVPHESASEHGAASGRSEKIDYGSVRLVAEFPDKVLMAAFHQVPNRLLVATAGKSWVRIFAVSEKLSPAGATEVRDGIADPLAVHWWQPEPDGPLYLAVTASVVHEKAFGNIRETRMGGAIYAWDGAQLVPVVDRVGLFLGSLDLDGDGRPETLLGQEFDPERAYGRIFQLELEKGELARHQPAVPLPDDFVVPGSAAGDLDGDGRAELVSNAGGELKIFSGGQQVFLSSRDVGGSLAAFSYDVNPGLTDTRFETVSLEVQPVLRDLDGDGDMELFLIAADTSALKVPGIGPGIDSSWVAVIDERDGMYRKGKLPFTREDPLQGLGVAAERLYLVESQTTSILSREGNSRLLVFPLAEGPR